MQSSLTRVVKKTKITKIKDEVELNFVLVEDISIYVLVSLITLAINYLKIDLSIILINKNEVLKLIIKIDEVELNKTF